MTTSPSEAQSPPSTAPARAPRKRSPNKSPTSPIGPITNYNSALKWLYSHVDYERMRIVPYNERAFSLDRMKRLLEQLGNPHHRLRAIQVAGTKGKGSTVAMLGSVLRACGYSTGVFTSPHLVDLRERIVVNQTQIPQTELVELFKLIAEKIEQLGGDPPSFFEILTAAALKHFAQAGVDVALLEVGLGGRLDATTAVDPLVCGVSRISYDHMNVLGSELTSIAREKAGIFKDGIPAVSVEQEAEVAEVLSNHAQEQGTPLEYTGREIEFSYRFEVNRELGPHTRVSITTLNSRWEHLPVPLRGEHQAHNCALALGLLDKLKGFGFELPEDRVINGLAQTKLAGRMEQVWNNPRVIIDGAHNAASIQALIRALGAHISYDSLVLVFGCGQDKDVAGMLRQISLGADKVVFTRAKNNPRAVEPEDLMTKFAEVSGKMAQTADTLADAVKLAARAVSREDLIVITGSFFLAGEAKKHFRTLSNKQKRK